MKYDFDPYPIHSYYLFQADDTDPIRAFEEATGFKVDRSEAQIFTLSEDFDEHPKQEEKSWWNSGWSHVAFGTVSTALGIGILCVATGPAGWVSGVLAIGGGTAGMVSGGGQLVSSDPETQKLFEQMGDASLSLNNIPGLAVGTTTYVFTRNFDQSVEYANYAGLISGGSSLAKSGFKAFKMQRLYNLEVGLNSTSWSTRTRGINAMLMEIDPKGLEGSHLIPQRVVRSLVERAPKFRRPIENLFNGPLGINFMPATAHALVDPYRFQTLSFAQKEFLATTNPFKTGLIEKYPRFAEVLGFYPNMSPTIKPMVNSLVITGGRVIKAKAIQASSKPSPLSSPLEDL